MMTLEDASSSSLFPLWGIIFISLTYLVMPFIYYLLRQNTFKLIDFYALSAIILFLIVGGYQLYFYAQKYHKDNKNIQEIPETIIDRFIPKIEWSVYIYNFLYYIGFGILLVFIKSYKEFVYICFQGLLLLASLFLFFMLFPTKLNASTRSEPSENKMLNLAQSCDDLTNAFPSAHVAVAVYIAFLLKKYIGNIAFAFPILIFLSCLCTKQHYFIDCIGGGVWGTVFSLLV